MLETVPPMTMLSADEFLGDPPELEVEPASPEAAQVFLVIRRGPDVGADKDWQVEASEHGPVAGWGRSPGDGSASPSGPGPGDWCA